MKGADSVLSFKFLAGFGIFSNMYVQKLNGSALERPRSRMRGPRGRRFRSREGRARGAALNMAAYLQWRRFVFFDRETVREPLGPDGATPKPFALPPGIAVCDSGRGNLVFGDILCGAGRCGLPGFRWSLGCSAGEFWALLARAGGSSGLGNAAAFRCRLCLL